MDLQQSNIKRVLVYRIGSLGDTAVALPCFRLIARLYPSAERILLTNFPIHAKAPASAAVLDGSNLFHGYMRYAIGTRNPVELWRIARQIRGFNPDVLIYLMPIRSQGAVQRDKHFFRWAAGIRHIAGLPHGQQLVRQTAESGGLYEREAERLARSLADLGDAAPEDPGSWDLGLAESEKQNARNALVDVAGRQLIVCGPGTKMQSKDWGGENWRTLIAELARKYPEYGLALIGAREDFEVSDYASREWYGPKVNLCGRLTPRETAAVLEMGAVFLGPDSGPMHLAACVGTPCVIAFSARGLPGVWFPAGGGHEIVYRNVSCSGCNLETCIVEGRRCLTSIAVDDMANAVHSVLGRQQAIPRIPSRVGE